MLAARQIIARIAVFAAEWFDVPTQFVGKYRVAARGAPTHSVYAPYMEA